MKHRLSLIFSVVLGIVLVAIWLILADVEVMFNILAQFKIFYIFPLVTLFLLVYLLRSIRWKIILSPIETITVFESFKLCMTNYLVNFLVPIHAGEIAKSVLLKKMKGTPVSKSLLTAYVDKLADFLPIFLLLAVTPFLSSNINAIIYLISGILLVVLIIIAGAMILMIRKKNAASALLEKVLFFLPRNFKAKLSNFLALFLEAAASLPGLSSRLFEVFGLTLLAIILHCGYLWLFFYVFGINLSVLTVFVGYLLLNASLILPAPPGFSGSLELTVLFIFSYLFHFDKNIVSAVAASSHIFAALLFGIIGIISITLIGAKLSTLFKVGIDRSE